MKVSTDFGDLPVPDELEKAYRAYLEEEGITEDDTDFDDFMMEHEGYDEKIVSAELYEFLIIYELNIIPSEGGYPHSWTMTVPGYEVTCFGWIDSGDIKHLYLNMLAKKITKDEYYVNEEKTLWRLEEGKVEKMSEDA